MCYYYYFSFQFRREHKKESQEICEGKKPLSYGLRLTHTRKLLGKHFVSIFGRGGCYQVESVLCKKAQHFRILNTCSSGAFYFTFQNAPSLFSYIFSMSIPVRYPSSVFFFWGGGGGVGGGGSRGLNRWK